MRKVSWYVVACPGFQDLSVPPREPTETPLADRLKVTCEIEVLSEEALHTPATMLKVTVWACVAGLTVQYRKTLKTLTVSPRTDMSLMTA